MSSNMILSALPLGVDAVIFSLPSDEACAFRLAELGFYPGAKIKRLFSAIFGDPIAFSVQNAVIALRRSESDRIVVKPL